MDWEEAGEHRMEWEEEGEHGMEWEVGGAATPAATQVADPEQGPMWGCCSKRCFLDTDHSRYCKLDIIVSHVNYMYDCVQGVESR